MPNSQDAGVPDDLVELGRIVSAYGVKGWVKIQPHSAQAEVLFNAKKWWLQAPVPPGSPGALSRAFAAKVVAVRPHSATVVAQLDIVPDRDRAEALKGHTVWVPRSEFPAAGDDEFYWVDLIDCQLWGEHDGVPALIGVVAEVIDNGAHAILRVARASLDEQGALRPLLNEKGRSIEVLVPFVSAHVHTVDIAHKRLDSNWPVEL